MMLKYISLFSGIGGFDLGFDRAGMECVLQVEKDDKARAVLAYHWPNVPKMELVEDVARDSIRRFGIAAIDLICGGFPCQDLSLGGHGKGLAGKRSGLWFEFHRIITELKPGWVVIENVTGLLSSNRGRDFALILRGLAESGYLSAWRVFNAQYFNVPQQRERVFIVANLGTGNAAKVLFEEKPNLVPALQRDTAPAPVYAYKKRGGYGWSESCEIALTLESQSGPHTGGSDTIPLIFDNGLPRYITPLEAERIQGFPDNWTATNKGKTQTYRQVGNAVVPYVAEWIGARIVEVDTKQSVKA